MSINLIKSNMTPQEKAKELFIEFSGNTIHHDAAKRCTLKCVDECINIHYSLDSDRFGIGESYKYWLEVKQEIEKL